MLYNLKWLDKQKPFPPTAEMSRIVRYQQNASLFDGDHFSGSSYRHRNGVVRTVPEIYDMCARRISRVVDNFSEVISFPVLLNYQRFMSLKMADLVCGEYPTITGATSTENKSITECRQRTDLDSKLYTAVIDISRYGDAIFRIYKDTNGKQTFTIWDPVEWYPVVSRDGTNTILYHCLCWRVNLNPDEQIPNWELHVQIHGTSKKDIGHYESRVYAMDVGGSTITRMLSSETVSTGLDTCAVLHAKAFTVSNSIYGYDDYMPIDSILAEVMTRIGQISTILDKHADPNITGPASMLSINPKTGERYLAPGKFFAISPGEEAPSYMTWEGQLTSAFKELELLIDQLYILSELGAAMTGAKDGGSQAISGTAMRFKMVNPLAKARRIANSLTTTVKTLLAAIGGMPTDDISILWEDGLPDDPRENIENAKLASGETKLMPLRESLIQFFDKSEEEADVWVNALEEKARQNAETFGTLKEENPNKPGPQDGTGVNPQKKGSDTGLNNFKGLNNKKDGK